MGRRLDGLLKRRLCPRGRDRRPAARLPPRSDGLDCAEHDTDARLVRPRALQVVYQLLHLGSGLDVRRRRPPEDRLVFSPRLVIAQNLGQRMPLGVFGDTREEFDHALHARLARREHQRVFLGQVVQQQPQRQHDLAKCLQIAARELVKLLERLCHRRAEVPKLLDLVHVLQLGQYDDVQQDLPTELNLRIDVDLHGRDAWPVHVVVVGGGAPRHQCLSHGFHVVEVLPHERLQETFAEDLRILHVRLAQLLEFVGDLIPAHAIDVAREGGRGLHLALELLHHDAKAFRLGLESFEAVAAVPPQVAVEDVGDIQVLAIPLEPRLLRRARQRGMGPPAHGGLGR
eukprot:3468092-Pyramimonas_sp.AAC.1